ncbi:MAG: NADH-quinone oxidoreductase subunit C [Parachlamydiales bacterium]|jgi:NADH-quinone oxidoreductase subunit C
MNTIEAVEKLKQELGENSFQIVEFRGETTIHVKKDQLKKALSALKQAANGFEVLMDLTGVDYIQPHKHTKVVYWLFNPTNYERIRVVVSVDREEPLPSVTDLWIGANWYERELYDLFGVLFEGHPQLKRILMPDDWKGHPLRRDYALTEESVEFKHNVKPKVPSEIIPYVKKYK